MSFSVNDEFDGSFIQFSAENGIQKNDKDLALSGGQLQFLLKSYIARDLWTNNEFYEIANEKDPKFETAITILSNWDKYEVMLLNSK